MTEDQYSLIIQRYRERAHPFVSLSTSTTRLDKSEGASIYIHIYVRLREQGTYRTRRREKERKREGEGKKDLMKDSCRGEEGSPRHRETPAMYLRREVSQEIRTSPIFLQLVASRRATSCPGIDMRVHRGTPPTDIS